MVKFILRLSILLALLLTACSSAVPEIIPPSDLAYSASVLSVTPELIPTTTPTPAPNPTADAPGYGTASFRGIRFQYDPDFVSTVQGQIVPGQQGITPDLDIPEHLRFRFDDVTFSNQFNPREPQLLIFPIDDFRAVSAKRAELVFNDLAELLQERPVPLSQELVLIPKVEGKPVFQTHPKYLQFKNGEGIRLLVSYSEEIGPITNETLFYSFQGISADREYYVSLFFPVAIRQFPDTFEQTDAANDYWTFVANYDTYLVETIDLIEGIRDSEFSPDLARLDKMIESLYLPDASIGLKQVNDPEKITDRIRREGKSGLRALWRDLGVTSILFDEPGDLNLELFDMKVDGARDEYRLLLISDTNNLDWQYLLFRSVGTQWLFVGSVDLPDQKYLPPACRIIQKNGVSWWAVTWLQNSEPGITQYNETWYRFREGNLEVVLNYPLEGYQISSDFAYNVSYKGDLVSEGDAPAGSLQLKFNISYSIYGDGEQGTGQSEYYKLIDFEQTAAYIWDDQDQQYILNSEESQLTQQQLDAAFYFPGPDPAIIQLAQSELTQIAQNGTPLQKRWLMNFLENLEASPIVEELKNQIGG